MSSIELRHRLVGEAHAGALSLSRVAANSAARPSRRSLERHALQVRRGASPRATPALSGSDLARHHRIGQGAIRHGRGHRPDRVERVGQRKRAVGRNALLARLAADDAAQRGGNAAWSRQCRCRSRSRTCRPRPRRRRPRTSRRAHARDRPDCPACRNADWRQRRRRRIRSCWSWRRSPRRPRAAACTTGASAAAAFASSSERLRARARHLARHVEQVLDADDRAVERAKRNAGPGARIGGIGGGRACSR